MEIFETHQTYRVWRQRVQQVALVPTMGALHEAHLALIRRAKTIADTVVVSIFVNPLQFGPNEDYERYPRARQADLALCEELGVTAVFIPEVTALYPEGQAITRVVPPKELDSQLCSLQRPVFFTGVATVVLKLFNLLQPTFAIFGEKDAQQLAIIQRMVRDLDVPVEIISHPIVRESDGLAMSSRNTYLQTDEERQRATAISKTLFAIQALYRSGNHDPTILAHAQAAVAAETGFILDWDYLEARDAYSLQPVDSLGPTTRLFAAARVGSVRLIDNLLLGTFS